MRSKYLRDTATLIALLAPLPPLALAAPPDWLQAAAREQLPKYAQDTPAVMLRNEQIVTVKGNNELTTVYRRAYKILRPEGRHYGTARIYFDSETRVTSLKGWSISAAGTSYEIGEKEAVDTVLFSDKLYEDTRQKVLRIPAAGPGAVVGYEYEQRRRPSVLQDHWLFQEEVPVKRRAGRPSARPLSRRSEPASRRPVTNCEYHWPTSLQDLKLLVVFRPIYWITS